MLPVTRQPVAQYRLTLVLAALLALVSVAGVAVGGRGLYAAYPASLAGLVGQDVVTLGFGLPMLLASAWLARRGSTGALLVWTGALFYFAYTYYFLVVGAFNALFPAYAAIVALSLFGAISLVLRVDAEALRARFAARGPVRAAAAFCIAIAVFFVLFWGGLVAGSIAGGRIVDPVMHLVVAIDGTVMLPLLLVGGALLWRRQAFGYVLGGLLLTKLAATGFGLAFTTTLGMIWARAAAPFEVFLLAIWLVMMLGGLLLLVPYLRAADGAEPGARLAAPLDTALTAGAVAGGALAVRAATRNRNP